ncbi:anthocyanidin 3-O-glucosyltransferase 7 [Selaginella moellendorffii]|nr:anthocyanidin 3-O-glucosyltransferase 7 [Selaginella moellendorffii]|eukprot:XP_002977333.2 anthocyanidin 3-O-glucosyltransferase 7 [Selaginella moellendorffii]
MAAATLAHIVAVPILLQGHIAPMLHLAHAIARTGRAIVSFITAESHARVLAGSKHSWYWQGIDESRLRFLGLPDSSARSGQGEWIDEQGRWRGGMDAFAGAMTGHMAMEATLAATIEGLESVDCFISDSLSPVLDPIASKLGIPLAALWTGSASLFALYLDIQSLVDNGYIPVQGGKSSERVIRGVPGIRELQVTDLPTTLYTDQIDPGYQKAYIAMARLREVQFAIVNACEGLEGEVLAEIRKSHPNLLPVGPLVKIPGDADDNHGPLNSSNVGLWDENHDCITWLDSRAQHSVIYISFGSMSDFRFEEIESIGQGIAATGRSFLWVLREELVRDMPEDFVKMFARRTKEQGMVIPWSPQSQVLNHKAVGGFFTHCGWSSCMEAILAGVPMLALPRFVDQMFNAKVVCDDWEVGLRMIPKGDVDGVVSRDRVEVGINALVEKGGELRSRAMELRKKVGAGSRESIEGFIDSIVERRKD